MIPPLDLSPASLRFIGGTGPALPPEVLHALGLPSTGVLYGDGAGEVGRAISGGGAPDGGSGLEPVAKDLTGLAVAQVGEVLRHPEGGRELAFQLLAADALLTWACEAAADAAGPELELLRVVSALTDPAR